MTSAYRARNLCLEELHQVAGGIVHEQLQPSFWQYLVVVFDPFGFQRAPGFFDVLDRQCLRVCGSAGLGPGSTT
jgi:hypothetical protein